MRVVVRLFAAYRELAGTGRIELDLARGATAADAIAALGSRLPRVAGGNLLLALNREYAEPTASLADGDELALIPPVSGGDGAASILISAAPLSLDAAIAAVRGGDAGGIVAFLGTVRSENRGTRVTKLEYEAYAQMAETTMRDIADRLERTHGARIALHHRIGTLTVGEVAVVVVAAAPHRAEAFAAARAAIDELKSTVPIWKKEYSADGAVWLEDHA